MRAPPARRWELAPGEVLGLVGDNAAGKSTMMKLLTGVYRPDAGEIRVDGRRVAFHSPRDSRALGIEMIYRNLALAPNLDVVANVFLGRELTKKALPHADTTGAVVVTSRHRAPPRALTGRTARC